jgi:hypothetical protein
MKITTNILNPNSKFRRKMNGFDLAGDYITGKKRMYSLIDVFHEEYILNEDRVPKLQWEYLKDDIKYIDNKIKSLSVLMRNQDEDQMELDKLGDYWSSVRNMVSLDHTLRVNI